MLIRIFETQKEGCQQHELIPETSDFLELQGFL